MKELRLVATPAGLNDVNAFIEDELNACECPGKPFSQLMVALEELYINIALYAYDSRQGDVIIQFGFDKTEQVITIRLIDWGMPFDPLAKADPNTTLPAAERQIGGLGIFMVKKTMDVFTYERSEGRNIVTIGKKIR